MEIERGRRVFERLPFATCSRRHADNLAMRVESLDTDPESASEAQMKRLSSYP